MQKSKIKIWKEVIPLFTCPFSIFVNQSNVEIVFVQIFIVEKCDLNSVKITVFFKFQMDVQMFFVKVVRPHQATPFNPHLIDFFINSWKTKQNSKNHQNKNYKIKKNWMNQFSNQNWQKSFFTTILTVHFHRQN